MGGYDDMRAIACLVFLCASALPAWPQTFADIVLKNGRLISLDAAISEAIAIRDHRIVALGTTQDIQTWVGPHTQVIDLLGHTVIPGLVDSHIHAIRAGLTEQSEVSWTGASSVQEAIDRLVQAARKKPRGSWLIVAGGWTDKQFREGRRPSVQEMEQAIAHHPVYIQKNYVAFWVNAKGAQLLQLHHHAELASRLTEDLDKSGHPTGWLNGSARTISDVYNLLPAPTLQQQMRGSRQFFKKLNSYGITSVLDPGGYNLPLQAYQAVTGLAKRQQLSLRIHFSISAPRRHQELQDFQRILRHKTLPIAGEGMLYFNGLGENVTWGMYNNERPTPEDQQQLKQVLLWAATEKRTVTFHWNSNETVHLLLDVIEAVNQQQPIQPLRWSIAHLNNASVESLQRMQALQMGWLIQNASYFEHDRFIEKYGAPAVLQIPPIATGLALGLPIGAGTDAHRVMSFNPFVCLQWLIDGKTVDGRATRAPSELLSRMEALRLYTQGSAWFAHADQDVGDVKVGMLADLAVLDRDYLSIPVADISALRARLTLVGGKVVYASGAFARP